MPDWDFPDYRKCAGVKIYEEIPEFFQDDILYSFAVNGDGCRNYLQDDCQSVNRSAESYAGENRSGRIPH